MPERASRFVAGREIYGLFFAQTRPSNSSVNFTVRLRDPRAAYVID
jgi:hypothetical protein